MRVLKIVLEGMTTSFRYPHFMLSVQPSFPLPPPETIYGHICTALGEWVAPDGLAFAYHFTAAGEGEDIEHIHVLAAATGKLPGTRIAKVLEGNVNPFTRNVLRNAALGRDASAGIVGRSKRAACEGRGARLVFPQLHRSSR